jgi:GntR family transcriptional regulator / MocR family aminotransferase
LQGLDDAGQVIYVGSLGKMLYPGLRMGYMVVPEHLVDTFRVGIAELYREGQLMQQAILTEFILDGHLTSHVRRMRGLYGERREILINAIRARFGDTLAVRGDEAGLHFVLELPGDVDDRAVTAQALAAGVVTRPLVNYYMKEADARRGLMLGYACVPNEQIAPNFAKLAEVIERELTDSRRLFQHHAELSEQRAQRAPVP